MVVCICIYSFEGTFVEKKHFWDKTFRLFIGKVSQKHPDCSLFTQDFPQCDFCGIGWRFFNLTYTFWMLVFVDVLTWLNVRVHSIRSDSVVLLPPKAEARQVFPRYAVLLIENQTNRFPPFSIFFKEERDTPAASARLCWVIFCLSQTAFKLPPIPLKMMVSASM